MPRFFVFHSPRREILRFAQHSIYFE
jgi:hypothetical protein